MNIAMTKTRTICMKCVKTTGDISQNSEKCSLCKSMGKTLDHNSSQQPSLAMFS